MSGSIVAPPAHKQAKAKIVAKARAARASSSAAGAGAASTSSAAKTAAAVVAGSTGVSNAALLDPSTIRNKIKRQEIVRRREQLKALIRKKAKLRRDKEEEADPVKKEKRLANAKQNTLDNKREADETVVAADDEEVAADEQQDEFASYFEHGLAAKIIVTTSRRASANAQAFATELADIFPGAEYIRRQPNYDIQHIQKFAAERGYTDLLIVNNDTKTINALTVVHLPEGPTMHFRLTSVKMAKRIRGHGKAQEEYEPELILNGFGTRLGHTVGRQLAALFPHVPKFHGRQVCTVGKFHNQRDFIFFRRHRYVFHEDGSRADLQELGPRFTLKLLSVQRGTFATKQGDYEWVYKPDMVATSRTRFFL